MTRRRASGGMPLYGAPAAWSRSGSGPWDWSPARRPAAGTRWPPRRPPRARLRATRLRARRRRARPRRPPPPRHGVARHPRPGLGHRLAGHARTEQQRGPGDLRLGDRDRARPHSVGPLRTTDVATVVSDGRNLTPARGSRPTSRPRCSPPRAAGRSPTPATVQQVANLLVGQKHRVLLERPAAPDEGTDPTKRPFSSPGTYARLQRLEPGHHPGRRAVRAASSRPGPSPPRSTRRPGRSTAPSSRAGAPPWRDRSSPSAC